MKVKSGKPSRLIWLPWLNAPFLPHLCITHFQSLTLSTSCSQWSLPGAAVLYTEPVVVQWTLCLEKLLWVIFCPTWSLSSQLHVFHPCHLTHRDSTEGMPLTDQSIVQQVMASSRASGSSGWVVGMISSPKEWWGLEQAAQGSGGSLYPWWCSRTVETWHVGSWFRGHCSDGLMVGLGHPEVFSTLNGSMILGFYSVWGAQTIHITCLGDGGAPFCTCLPGYKPLLLPVCCQQLSDLGVSQLREWYQQKVTLKMKEFFIS